MLAFNTCYESHHASQKARTHKSAESLLFACVDALDKHVVHFLSSDTVKRSSCCFESWGAF